jgi:hypothetical protein
MTQLGLIIRRTRIFFDHLTFRIYWWNTRIVKETDVPIFATILGVSVLQSLNISSLFFAIDAYLLNGSVKLSPWTGTVILIALCYLNQKRYVKTGYLLEIVLTKKAVRKRQLDMGVIIYIILTFVFLFWFASELREYFVK